ncbi:DUF4038 domain-containing protein [Candidatus Poribacteria bacterium]
MKMPNTRSVAWPLRVSADKRYLEDQNGVPFFVQAETVWNLTTELELPDIDLYMDDMEAKGFNTIYMRIKAGLSGDGYGREAFLDNDLTKPNEAYFSGIVDHIVDRALNRDILIVAVMIWHKNEANTTDGKKGSPLRYSQSDMATYGSFLGNRYNSKDGRGNVIFVGGGDILSDRPGNGVDRPKYEALANALLDVYPEALVTYHSGNGRSSLDDWGYCSWLKINSLYQRQGPFQWEHARGNWNNYKDVMPIILQEGLYETASRQGWRGTPLNIRKQQWWYLTFGSTGGINYGHERIFGFPPGWKDSLDAEARLEMIHIRNFVLDLEWWKREPDVSGSILMDDGGIGDYKATACRACDGSYTIVYTPNSSDPRVNMSMLSEPAMAKWYNPRTGVYFSATGPYDNSGIKTFSRPDSDDWVLLLEIV